MKQLLSLLLTLTALCGYAQSWGPTADSLRLVRQTVTALAASSSATSATTFNSALIIVDFNSLGAGRGSSHEITSPDDYAPGPFPVTMMNSLTATFPSATFTKKNFSVSGRQTPTMISQMSQVTATFNPSAYDRQIVVCGEGTNHIADGGVTALAAYNSFVTYCKGIRSGGGLVVPTTILPRTTFFQSGISAATFKVRADSFNLMLRANYLQYSDVLADIATIPGITYPDGTHTNDAGYVLIGNFIASKVAPLLRTGFNPQSIPFLLAGTLTTATTPASNTSVALLLRGQGANNSTAITDDAVPPHSMSAVNTMRISTAQFKYGSSSLYFDGGANTHIHTPASTDFDFGTKDFTMEAWCYKLNNGTGFPGLFARGDNSGNQWVLCFPNAGARLEFYVSSVNGSTTSYTAQGLNTTTDFPLNQWVHVALVRAGGGTKLYQNGVLVGTATTNSNLETNPNSKPLKIGFLPAVAMGDGTGDRFNGYMQYVRFTKGVALYPGPFTAPTAAY